MSLIWLQDGIPVFDLRLRLRVNDSFSVPAGRRLRPSHESDLGGHGGLVERCADGTMKGECAGPMQRLSAYASQAAKARVTPWTMSPEDLLSNLQVLVMSASKDMQGERIRLASEFWRAGISAEFTYKANPFMPEQMFHATASGIPVCVVLRPAELQEVSHSGPSVHPSPCNPTSQGWGAPLPRTVH